MRIIAGQFGGRVLTGPSSILTRPVSDKVKGAIFNILGDITDFTALDVFAGTGSVGLEAVSRGAKLAVFIDDLPVALNCLRKNIETLGVEGQTRVVKGKVPLILKSLARYSKPFHLVFVDPPYDKNLVNPTLDALAKYKMIDAVSTVIIEHSPREKPTAEGFTVTDERQYGQTCVSFLKLK